MAKAASLNYDDLFASLASGIQEQIEGESGTTLNVIEFVEQECDLGIELTAQQKTILKAFYNLPLSIEEVSILEFWKLKDRCTWEPDGYYQALVLESGRRSGKTSLSAIITAYEFYSLCKLASPQQYYGIARSTPISILVLATTASQGKKTIFKNVVGTVKNCKYFQNLERQGKLFIGKEEITYEEKLLYIYSGNSQSGSQVGGTMKAMIMDEVARFKDSDGDSNAIELWSNLGIATTTFGKDARRVAISSAWYEGDAIQQLFESTITDSTALGLRTRSWDLNPIHAARDNPVVASEYSRDPVKAAIEFEGIRPAAVDAFLSADEVKAAFRGRSVIKATRYEQTEADHNLVNLRIESVTPFAGKTSLHIDPAIDNDAYALAFGHNEFDEQERQIVVIDGLLAWEPSHSSQVSITDVQEAIIRINHARPIYKLTADHYNSAETIQRLRRDGIRSEVQFFSNRTQLSMYDLVRMLLHENRLILPSDSPWTSLAMSELCKVQLIKGSKIDHPRGGSKDIADCIAAVCWNLASRLVLDQVNSGQVIKTVHAAIGQQSSASTVSQVINSAAGSRHRVMSNLRGYDRWRNR